MIAIDDVLISDEILKEDFACNVSACKGACCWEGDYGAPVDNDEQNAIREALPIISKQLSLESKEFLLENDAFLHYKEPDFTGTALHKDGSCIFMTFSTEGTAQCAIEKAKEEDSIPNLKPLSCHLYPIRVSSNPKVGFEAWNYDRWEICNPACVNGKKSKIKIYEFAKDAIIRKKGEAFYEQLSAAAQHLESM